VTSALRLETAGIAKQGRWIVREASLDLRANELTCVLGPNGSGKSSLLKMLGGLWQPMEGRALLDDTSLDGWRRRQIARRVAFVPQNTRLGFEFTVREVVAMGRYPHEGRMVRAGDSKHPAIDDAIARTDIGHLAQRYVNTLSGGESQRVLLARCLAAQADILLLDEPTAALDLKHSLEVMALCRSLARDKKAVCVALHDLNAALRFGDRALVMADGRIVADGAPRDVLTKALIHDVFGVVCEVLTDGDGRQVFVFHE